MMTARRKLAALAICLSALLLALPAEALQEGFEPYKPEAAADTAPLFVVIAYSAIWVILLAFVVSIWRRQRRVEQELRTLARELAEPARD